MMRLVAALAFIVCGLFSPLICQAQTQQIMAVQSQSVRSQPMQSQIAQHQTLQASQYQSQHLQAPPTQGTCSARADYRAVCEALNPQSHCSPQLTSLCCGCEAEWGANLSYCRFTQALFPTPTPTGTPTPVVTIAVTPTATATPRPQPTVPPVFEIPTDSGAGRVQCHVAYSHEGSACDATVQLLIDGTRSKGREFVWESICSTQGVRAESSLAVAGATSRLSLAEPVLGTEVECTVKLRVMGRGADGRDTTEQCGTKILVNNCSLGCRSYYVPSELFAMDGQALAASIVVRRLSRIVQATAGGATLSRRLKLEAQDAYHRAWGATWSLPFFFKTCASVSCQAVAHTNSLSTYSAEVIRLFDLSTKGLERVRRFGSSRQKRQAGALFKRAQALRSESLATSTSLPTERSVCR